MLRAIRNEAVELYFDNSLKLSTTKEGVLVSGGTTTGDFKATGVSTFTGLVNIDGGGQANTFKVEDLTDNRIVIAGTGGELEDSANLTFNGSTLAVTGDIDANGDLDVDGTANLDDVNIAGIATLSSGAFPNNVSVGERTYQTNVDIRVSSLRSGIVVRNMNNFRTDNTFNSAFMVLDPFTNSAKSFAFRAAEGIGANDITTDSGYSANTATLSDTFWVKTNGDAYFSGKVGIGSTTPQDILTLRTGDDVTSLRLIDPTADTYGGHFSFYNTANEVRIGGVYNNDKRAVIRIHRDADDDAIVIDGTNNITFDGNLFRNTVHNQDIGSSSNPWDKVYASEFIGLINTTQENVTTGNLLVTGIATFQGNVSIAGTLTYEDVTNIDSIGIITARKDVHVGAGVSAVGVGSFGSVQLDGGVTLENSTTTGTGKALKIISPSGYIEVGSQNTNNAHFYTDRPRFYFNKRVLVDEGIIGSFDEDLVFVTDQNEERLRIENDTGNVGIGTAANDGDAKLVIEGVTALTNVDQTVMVRDSNSDDAVGRGGNIGFGAYVDGTMRTLAAIGGVKKNSGNSFNGNLALYTRRSGQATLDQRLTILSTGEVGINDTNPSSTLTVAGDVSITRGTTSSGLTRTLSIGGARNQGSNFASIDLKNYDSDSTPVADYVAARITGTVPSTPNNGGELVFFTSQTGSGVTVEERLRIGSSGITSITGEDDQDNFIVDVAGTQFAVHTDATDGEISLRAQEGTGSNNSKFITFFTQESGSAAAEKVRIASDGKVGIGTNPQYNLHVVGTAAATNFDSLSDRRYKTNIKVIENPIEKIKKIDGVSFNWKETNEPSLGVIADDVLEVLPEIVSGKDTKSVNYNGLIGVLIEVVKDQQKQIDELRGLLDN